MRDADKATRGEVAARDKWRCVICGDQRYEIHEIIPKSALPGERNESTLFSVQNRCCLCRRCHDQVHTFWGRVMLLGLLRVKHGYPYRRAPFASYFKVTKL